MQASHCSLGLRARQPAQLQCRRPPRAAVSVAAVAAAKGFGAAKKSAGDKKAAKEGCPCGSGKSYKQCCKQLHSGAAVAPSVEDTVRARFSAIHKKDVSFLLKTTHPDYHCVQYGTEPGGALRQLQDDYWNSVDHYDYSGLRFRGVQPGDAPNEALAIFQYSVYDKRTPAVNEHGETVRKVTIEQSRFVQAPDGGWRFADAKVVEVPEAFARAAEAQAQDMAASKQEQQQQAAASS